MADKGKEEGSSNSTSDGQNNEEFETVTRRKRKKDTAEDMDTSVSAKRPSFPPLSGESLTVKMKFYFVNTWPNGLSFLLMICLKQGLTL